MGRMRPRNDYAGRGSGRQNKNKSKKSDYIKKRHRMNRRHVTGFPKRRSVN